MTLRSKQNREFNAIDGNHLFASVGTRAPGGFAFDVAKMRNSANPFLQARVPPESEFPQGRVLQQKDVSVLQQIFQVYNDQGGLAKHGG